MVKIESKIKSYAVVAKPNPDQPAQPASQPANQAPAQPAAPAPAQAVPPPQSMNESIDRPDSLEGSTYKIRSPMIEHAMYVTINDIVLNPGTAHESRRPFEIFINSKNMDQFQWIVALTRVASAVFRKGGDVAFLAEELRGVFDPRGGYFKAGGVYMNSVVAEIGTVFERHLTKIGMIKPAVLSDAQQALIDEKRAAHAAAESGAAGSGSAFPAGAAQCQKCHQHAVVKLDGCMTCLNCADSKCG